MGIGIFLSSFGAGMLATVNPCGFAMLPAYISYFLNADGSSPDSSTATAVLSQRRGLVLRALQVGGIMTTGFLVLFVSAGTLISLGASFIVTMIPWAGLAIGVLLVFMGVWVLTGHHLPIPRLLSIRFKKESTFGGFFLYGVAYGLTSLTCTLPIFLAVVGSVFTNGEVFRGIGQFVMYSFGMGLVIVALTVSIAFFKGVLVERFQQIFPYIERISAVLLIAAGGYLLYNWLVAGRLIEGII